MSTKFIAPSGYQVLDNGRVLSHSNWRGRGTRPLTWGDDGSGYPVVRMLCEDGKRRKFKVHQLVCAKFHGPRPSDKHEVRHLDGNPRNNNANNLAWGTKSDNARDRVKHGRQYMPEWDNPEFREKAISGMRKAKRKKRATQCVN